MNAGAYDAEIGEVLTSLRVIRAGGGVAVLGREDLKFSYRGSVLQSTGDLALEASLRLAPGDPARICGRMEELAAERAKKQPVNLPSAGSFFKRPPGNFAGKLIAEAGLGGLRVGGAQVSGLHAGFIVNRGGATASDITDLMKIVQSLVFDRSGVMLEPEVRIIGEG
jgi:UDP-N-acetylmuramate dehydrogenase